MVNNRGANPKGEVLMTRTRKTWSLACLFAAGLLIASLGTACKAEKEEIAEPKEKLAMSVDMLTPILGKGEGSMSGVLDVDYGENGLAVSYYLFIEDTSTFAAKLGTDLAPKLKELYAKYQHPRGGRSGLEAIRLLRGDPEDHEGDRLDQAARRGLPPGRRGSQVLRLIAGLRRPGRAYSKTAFA
jgi:hypothetical protein